MHKVRLTYSWIIVLLVVILFRLINGNLFQESTVVAMLLLSIGLHWFVFPYLYSKDISLPGNPSTIFRKGEDDFVRGVLFVLGISLAYVSLVS